MPLSGLLTAEVRVQVNTMERQVVGVRVCMLNSDIFAFGSRALTLKCTHTHTHTHTIHRKINKEVAAEISKTVYSDTDTSIENSLQYRVSASTQVYVPIRYIHVYYLLQRQRT